MTLQIFFSGPNEINWNVFEIFDFEWSKLTWHTCWMKCMIDLDVEYCWVLRNSIDDWYLDLWDMLIMWLIEMYIDFTLCIEYDLSWLLNFALVKIHYTITIEMSIKPDTPINVYTRFCLNTAKSKFFLVSPVADWWKTINKQLNWIVYY